MNDQSKISNKGMQTQNELLTKMMFWAMLLSYLVISTICLVNAVKWVNKHFPGFLLNERMLVAPIGQYHWTGTQAGMKYPDKILTANGQKIASIKELDSVLNSVTVGDPVTYTVKRGADIFETKISTMLFTWADLFMTFGATFFAAMAYMLIGTIVYTMKPDKKVSWIFLLACYSLGVWTITIFDVQSTHFGFVRLYLLAQAIYPAAFLHFSWYFPEPRKFVLKRPMLQLIPYAIALFIIVPIEILYPRKGFQIFYSINMAYIVIASISVLYPVIASFIRPLSAMARQRAKVVMFGAAIALPPVTILYFFQLLLGSFFGVRVQTNFLMLPLLAFPASIGYAIARHNLFDVDVYIKRAVGYFIITAIIIGAYAVISIPLNIVMGKYDIAQSRVTPIIFTLGVILIFNPLYQRIQSFVDRVFFRKEYNYGEIVDKVGNAMTTLLDLPQVLKRLATTFTEDMFINTISVMLLTPEGTEYRVFLSEGENKELVENVNIDRKNPLIEIIEKEKAEITKYEVLEDPKYKNVSEGCAVNFEELCASLMIPLIYQDHVIGLLNLGEKKSGKFYSREDVELARNLANQGAMAIENARMVEEVIEKERMEEELNIARDLQVSMLPPDCPQIAGIEIAAYSLSAREVGGDFYDFIEMDQIKTGVVIGDVTGKSVSGALVMSASRSIFRMLSEEEMSVSESMKRANLRLKKDIKSGMFVALLFAVLNSQNRSLTICSAGQTQPIHLSSKTGEARLVETEGDTFPLGILDEADYQDTQFHLNPGDSILFYTDGIVEAMNEQEKIFGFERLLDVVKNSQSETAQAMLEKINHDVNEFAGQAEQHDDITIIVIKAV